jgi:hypothetical protein
VASSPSLRTYRMKMALALPSGWKRTSFTRPVAKAASTLHTSKVRTLHVFCNIIQGCRPVGSSSLQCVFKTGLEVHHRNGIADVYARDWELERALRPEAFSAGHDLRKAWDIAGLGQCYSSGVCVRLSDVDLQTTDVVNSSANNDVN